MPASRVRGRPGCGRGWRSSPPCTGGFGAGGFGDVCLVFFILVRWDDDHCISAVSAGGRSIFAVFAADYRWVVPAGFLNPEADMDILC